jgi:DNA-binding MarR family transcriptional regulator
MEFKGKEVKLSQRTGHLISLVAELTQVNFDRRLKPYRVTRSQWIIIAAITEEAAKTAADIAKIITLNATAVTRLIDRLEAKGLVRRIQDKEDRRVNRLELTEKGQSLYPVLRDEADKTHDQFFGFLTESDENHLAQLLIRIKNNLSD